LNLDRLRELFSGVDWTRFEVIVNRLYTLKGKRRRPKLPIAYFRAVLVKMPLELSIFSVISLLRHSCYLRRKDVKIPSKLRYTG
jgi:hypothetical protein